MNARGKSWWTPLGAALAGLAVATGAIAAHGIDSYLAESHESQTRSIAGVPVAAALKYLADFKTASQYQSVHALGLIAIGILSDRRRSRALTAAGWLFVLGIALFCGSLYWLSLFAHVMTDEALRAVGLMAATGGTSFIAGWFTFAVAVCPGRTSADDADTLL
ncbi:MAG: DUF423 domain-containing protein [Planctomycetaceae bacterium]